MLARSAFLRYREALGESVTIPEGLYPGDYLKPVGEALAKEHGAALQGQAGGEWLPIVRDKALAMMMAMIREDLDALNVRHDVFFSERSLTQGGADRVGEAIEWLRAQGRRLSRAACRRRRARRSTTGRTASRRCSARPTFGDDVDRPLKKSDGSYTYFASDIAYHKDKIDRGFLNLDQRARRRPWRLRQAHAGGGEGAERGQGRVRRQARAARAADARRRAGEDVQARRRVRDAARGGRRSRRRRRALHDALPQERRDARFRPRQGDRAVARTTRCSMSSTAMRAAIRSSRMRARCCRTCRARRGARAAWLADCAARATQRCRRDFADEAARALPAAGRRRRPSP